jgi:hypothetical protein
MKQGEVFFHPMEGSGQLSISWSSAPKGAAVEAKKGNGVGFFSTKGNLLSVIFDDVIAAEDHQILEFKKYKIEVSVRCGIVKHKLIQLGRQKDVITSKKTTHSSSKRRTKTKVRS